MAKSAELAAIPIDNNSDTSALMSIPAEWGMQIPVEQYRTTIDISTEPGKRQLYLALNDEGVNAKEVVNTELAVTGITFAPFTGLTEEGEVYTKVHSKLSLKDGTIVGTNSEWIMRGLLSLIQFKSSVPSDKKPWRLQIYSKTTGKAEDGSPKSCLKVRDLDLAKKA
jgi:hypothetical protein